MLQPVNQARLPVVLQVNIANQIYDFMDKHINTLDADLQVRATLRNLSFTPT